MKCPKCKGPVVRAIYDGEGAWYCARCAKVYEPSETDPCQLKRPTPTEVPETPKSPTEGHVEPARPLTDCGPRQGRRSKYGNKVTERAGISFQSKHEADVYDELCMMEAAGEISFLVTQRRYLLAINDQKICVYVADFVYMQDGKQVVVDAKGFKTSVYKLKKKLMKACLGIDIVER